jgi:hypothetical protein
MIQQIQKNRNAGLSVSLYLPNISLGAHRRQKRIGRNKYKTTEIIDISGFRPGTMLA